MKIFYNIVKWVLSFIVSALIVIIIFDTFSSSIFYWDSFGPIVGSSTLFITIGAPIFILQLLTFILIWPLFITLLTPYVWIIIDTILWLLKKNQEIFFKNISIQFWELFLAFLMSLSVLILLGRFFMSTLSWSGIESVAWVMIMAILILINFFLIFFYIGFYWVLKKYIKGINLIPASTFVFLVIWLTYINAIIPSIQEAKGFLKEIEDRWNLNMGIDQNSSLITPNL